MRTNFEAFKAQYSGKVFIVLSLDGDIANKEVIDEILELILDTVCSTRKTIGIAGEQRPIDIVKSRFMKLDSGHLEFVLQSMSDNTTLVRNMKQYLLAALYNAPLTMNNYYKSLVKHDMASGII